MVAREKQKGVSKVDLTKDTNVNQKKQNNVKEVKKEEKRSKSNNNQDRNNNDQKTDRTISTKNVSEKEFAQSYKESNTINMKSATPAKPSLNVFSDPLTNKLKNLDLCNDEMEMMMEYINESNSKNSDKNFK